MHNAPMLNRLVWGARGHATGRVAEKSTGLEPRLGCAAVAIGMLVRCRPCLPLIPSVATCRSRTRRTARANPGQLCE